jgi:hypothetical protein
MFSVGLVVLGLMGIGAGCGSGDSTEAEAGSKPLSPTAFVREATQICEGGRQELHDATVSYQRDNGSLNPSDVGPKAVAATLLPVEQRVTKRLEDLVPPGEIVGRQKAFLATKRRELDEIERRKLSSNTELFKAFAGSDKMASDLQIETCSFG